MITKYTPFTDERFTYVELKAFTSPISSLREELKSVSNAINSKRAEEISDSYKSAAEEITYEEIESLINEQVKETKNFYNN